MKNRLCELLNNYLNVQGSRGTSSRHSIGIKFYTDLSLIICNPSGGAAKKIQKSKIRATLIYIHRYMYTHIHTHMYRYTNSK